MTQNIGGKGRSFEWWMISFVAAGAGWSAFISLLIPPFVTESTGNTADAGIVMAVISLAAVLAPVLGGFADKYRAHRLVLSLGVLGMALGFLMYSLSAEATAIYALDAIVLGIAAAAINAVGPVFVLGANLPQKSEANRLTVLNLLQPIGQVIGGAILALAVTANLNYSARFMIAASASGSFLGALIGGYLASSFGFNAINWMAAIAVGSALLLLLFFLWPVERGKQKVSS